MKKWSVLYLFLAVFFVSGCSSDRQEDDLPCLDVTRNYPEKEIVLTDIADVTFLCLDSDNEDFLYSGRISCITKNTIVIIDAPSGHPSGKILFFSKDGKPKSQFNHKGQGPEEYTNPHKAIYDEETDEVFVYSLGDGFIHVYSSAGEHKRKIVLPSELYTNHFYFFDDESFLIYDALIQFAANRDREGNAFPPQFYNQPCVRISKTDGKVLEYVNLPTNDTELVYYAEGRKVAMLTTPIISTEKGFLLCNPESDTVFLYDKNKVLTPVICKTPLVKDLNPIVVMNNCMDYGGYQFMDFTTLQYDPELPARVPMKYLVRNKKTGEVFLQKITLPDYKGKEFIIGFRAESQPYEEGVFFELELVELKQADRENRLSGKLKELVSTLNEEKDNNVFMFVDFKE